MKISNLIICFLVLINSSIAQINKGSVMLGGGFGLNSIGEEKSRINGNSVTIPGYTTYLFNPEIGYFINSHIALGAFFTSKTDKEAQVFSSNYKTSDWILSNTISVGLFLRNMIPLNEHVYLTQSLSAGYLYRQYNDRVASPTDASLIEDGQRVITDGFACGISPGLTYFFHPKWGIEMSLNNIFSFARIAREYQLNNNTIYSTQNVFSIGLGISPTFGLYYYVNK